MGKTIKMKDLIDEMSELYRAERKKGRSIYEEYLSVVETLNQHKKDDWRTITVAKHAKLENERDTLEKEWKSQEKYCDGIFDARELLMSLGFDTKVSL